MSPRPGLSVSHLGIFVTDLARMEDFYTRFLGFTVTDRGALDGAHGVMDLVFLSRDPGEHHQIVLITGRPAEPGFNVINQISLKADCLDTLQDFYRRLGLEAVTEIRPITHGNALSVYFRDPEANRIELFIDTPWYVDQPMRVAAPFELPEAELMRWAEAHARSLPGFRPREAWRAEMAKRMGLEP
jgi:catechol 2,3-dioxygenase-like lactoylglutathione lyase family enzyme